MVSKRLICIFAIVLVSLVFAEDYEGGYEGDGGDGGDGGGDGGDDGGYHGGDYDSEGGDGGEAAAGEGDGESSEESDESAAASHLNIVKLIKPSQRQKRSITTDETKPVLSRVRRGYGYGRVGPVYTYQKTDYNGNFKWGVRHNVGKQYGHGK